MSSIRSTYALTGTKTPAANETKSLWLLNPVTNQTSLTEIGIGSTDSAANKALKIELYRVTTIGSAAGTTGAQVKDGDPNAPTATTTSLYNLTTEPTAVDVLRVWSLPPNGAELVIQMPLGRETSMASAGARVGLRYTNPTGGTTSDLYYYVLIEE